MDKFGVFNLLKTLLELASKQKSTETGKDPAPNTPEKTAVINPPPPEKHSSALIHSAKKHDEFVKRVISANKKTP